MTTSNFSPESTMPLNGTMGKLGAVVGLMDKSVRLLLRRGIGLDLLRISSLIAVLIMMLMVSGIGNIHVGFSLFGGLGIHYDADTSLRNYAFLVFALGLWQRRKRLREEALGTEPHTCWPGDGWFDFIPLPQKYIGMCVEPAVTFIAGALLRYRLSFGLLGLWLMASAAAFCITEIAWNRQKQAFVRTHKNLSKEAQWWAEYERTRPKGAVANDGGASGVTIPTGNDEALTDLIAKNKRDNSFLD